MSTILLDTTHITSNLLQIRGDNIDYVNKLQEFYEHAWDKLLWFVMIIGGIATGLLGFIIPQKQKKEYEKRLQDSEKAFKKTQQEIEKGFREDIKQINHRIRKDLDDHTNQIKQDLDSHTNQIKKDLDDRSDDIKKELDLKIGTNETFIAFTNTKHHCGVGEYESALRFANFALENSIKLNSKKDVDTATDLILDMSGLTKEDVDLVFSEEDSFVLFFQNLLNLAEADEEVILQIKKVKQFLIKRM